MAEFPAVALCLALRADRQAREQFPWAATERMLMRNSDGSAPHVMVGNARMTSDVMRLPILMGRMN